MNLNGPASQRLKIKGLLADRFSRQLEQSYIRDGHAEMLRNIPCEMTFETNKGFVGNESSEHNYLPVFHLMGRVTEITGNFPYGVHTIYFDPSDSRYLSKDIRYYPSPAEIAHMVQTGAYFTKHFAVPNIMATNRYNFPAMVDLIVLPPDDSYSGSDDDVDKLKFPIIYVKLKGTGVDNRTDRLLKYYGIESDPEFETYNMTAEASGYTDPPLMQYIEAPEIPNEVEEVRSSDYYISEEEEKQMMQFQEQQEQAIQEPETTIEKPVIQLSDDDLILANAGMNITRRVEAKRLQQRQRQEDAHKHHERALQDDYQAQDESEDAFENFVEFDDEVTRESAVEHDVTPVQQPIQQPVKAPSEEHSRPSMVDELFAEDEVAEEPVFEAHDAEEPDEHIVVEDVMAEPVSDTLEGSQLEEPEKPEIYKEFEMRGAEPAGEAEMRMDSDESFMVFDDEDDYDDNDIEQESANASDVSDAHAQAKLNEANLTKLSRDVAVDKQEEIADENVETHTDGKHGSETAARNRKGSGREVSAMLMDIADDYDHLQDDEDSDQLD